MAFSSCGTYLVVQRDFPVNAEPVVIPCLEPPSHNEDEECPNSAGASPGSLKMMSLAGKIESEPPVLTPKPNTHQLAKADTSIILTRVSESVAGAEVSLSRRTEEGATETAKIVTLPRSAQFDGVVHTALPPRSRGDMFRVSVDMDPRRHYSLVERSNKANATVIERHPAFVSVTTTTSSSSSSSSSYIPHISAIAPGTGRLAAEGLDYGPEWRACPMDIPTVMPPAPRNARPGFDWRLLGKHKGAAKSVSDLATPPSNAASIVDATGSSSRSSCNSSSI